MMWLRRTSHPGRADLAVRRLRAEPPPPGVVAAAPEARPPLARRVRPTGPAILRWAILRRAAESGLFHLALLLVALLLALRHPDEHAAVSPPSFEMVLNPGAKPAPPPSAPAAPTRPPPKPEQPQPPPPPAAAPPTPAPAPAPVAAPPAPPSVRLAEAPPDADAILPPQASGPAAQPSVRLTQAAPPTPTLDTPPPVPVPQPAPEPAARPAPPRQSRTASRPPAFPKAMNLALNEAPVAPPDPVGDIPRELSAAEGMIHVRGAHVGKAWIDELYQWWLQHSYYPEEAVRREQDGTVKIHLRVDRYGHVRIVELENTSGSQWLDAGAQAVFRGAELPPFPLTTPEAQADLDLSIDYVLVRPRQ